MAKKKRTMKKLFRPTGCLSPNEAGKKLGVTGEALKQHIREGRRQTHSSPGLQKV